MDGKGKIEMILRKEGKDKMGRNFKNKSNIVKVITKYHNFESLYIAASIERNLKR